MGRNNLYYFLKPCPKVLRVDSSNPRAVLRKIILIINILMKLIVEYFVIELVGES